ncbi:NFX1-type zinc finger-containing protein 1-like isoform X1 [Montipora capricornis]|uniref:NFX1-type zinc finger-containing protein 1-like isoform X1 n=2 Tax=Montipora capricornis TaxID=246305 RepID=UPI0035F1FCE1
MPSQRRKWSKNYDKNERKREKPKESEEPTGKKGKDEELPSETTKEESQGACGTSADEKPDGRRMGRWAKKMEARKGKFRARKEDPGDNKEPTQNQTRSKPVENETCSDRQPATSIAQGTTKQAEKGGARGASVERERYHETSSGGRRKPLAKRNQEQCEGRAGSVYLSTQNTRPTSSRSFQGKSPSLDLKSLKKEEAIEVVHKLNEEISQLKFLIRSEKQQHNSDEFIFDLICTLAVACKAPQSEKKNMIIASFKDSSFLRLKIPHLLDCFQVSTTTQDQDFRQEFFECLITFFSTYLTHLPSSYADIPYDLLKRALDRSGLRRKENLEKALDAFKQARDGIIQGERQRLGKRYTNRARQKPTDDFRDIPICPTNKEITSRERPFLPTNIIKGRYENAEHYLDVQFRLLREDFLEPLREGIHELVLNIPRQQRNQLGMKSYPSVTISGKQFEKNGIIHQVQIDVSGFNTSRWGHSRLIYGTFLCLSQDNFKTMLFATVVERDEEQLKEGRIGIQFIGDQDVWDIESRKCNYQMVESPAYFEAYRHVLKGLTELNGLTLPFKKYLVECSEEIDPPKYLRRNDSQKPVYYDLSKALDVSDEWKATAVPVLQPEAWPPGKALPLNTSQLEALKIAVTTEFSVIQGPPGTGKTFVGTKIVRCLLENRNAWDPQHNSPMLMVCYTNHALDQFLEKLLEFLPKREIIRVGTRSKSVELEDCNLKNFTDRSNRLKNKYRDVRTRMKEHVNEIEKWKQNLAKAKLELRLLEFDDLEEMMNFAHADQLSNAIFPNYVANKSQRPDNTFRLWLCDNPLVNSWNQSTQSTQGEGEDENEPMADRSVLPENSSDEDIEDVILAEASMDVGDNNKTANLATDLNDPAIERVTGSSQYHRSFSQTEGHFWQSISEDNGEFFFQGQDQSATKEDEDEGWTVVKSHKKKGKSDFGGRAFAFLEQGNEEYRDCPNSPKGKKMITADISTVKSDLEKETPMTTAEVMRVHDIWVLQRRQRLQLYLCWVENYREHCIIEVRTSEKEYKQLCTELEAVSFEQAKEVIRQATVVGMTTTSAAKYLSVLKNVAPKIVVIEEAAEVMEAHILTSLTPNTEHTILIGDHKQLRPKAAVYELAQRYNLEVSLFERMVMNNMDCKRLSVQHRMRPEIAALTKRIYDHEIVDHASVNDFEDISGMCRNLFFIDHKQPERMVSGLQSYANDHEAQFIVALCKYLLLQGYKKTQITVLTMYIGQLLLLQDQLPRSAFKELKVCAVDNFQGEENDIILLSLVRSNTAGRIGFLAESNRVCVALSRARKGFYCIGNFSLLKSKSDLWKKVCDDLEAKNGIAESLQLLCTKHNNVTVVRKASDFNPLGGCNMPCGDRLSCGHACNKPCHVSSHAWGNCNKPCPGRCPNEHTCPRTCHHPIPCDPCRHKMTKVVPKCGHEQQIACSVEPEKFSCQMKCEKKLSCGHSCVEECGQKCTLKCQVICNKSLSCGHIARLPCFIDSTVYSKCNENCEKVLDCGHPCSKKCRENCQCAAEINITLQCEHTKRIMCRKKEDPIQCGEKCKRKLDCGHDCTGFCHEDCTVRTCKVEVLRDLPCGHQQSLSCYQQSKDAFCYAPCSRKLECGHQCPSVCGQLCFEVQCKQKCSRKCGRGHSCQKTCHIGSPCDDCTIEVDMTIPSCGHIIQKPCHINPSSLKCDQPCDRLRACGHPCKEICSRNCETNPCKVLVTSTLPCDHLGTLACYENPEEVICNKTVQVKLACGHGATLPCHVKPEDHRCNQRVRVKLSCGHDKNVLCSLAKDKRQSMACETIVARKLPCGHEKMVHCSIDVDKVRCDAPCERYLPCGHQCTNKCDDVCVSQLTCLQKCRKQLKCSHPCPGKCSEDCSQFSCQVMVKKDLNCPGNHSQELACGCDPKTVKCQDRCKRNLDCGHPCPGKCSEDCRQFSCKVMVEKNLCCPGNHSRKLPCSRDPKTVKCQESCERNLDCGHPCPGKCSQDCSQFSCQLMVKKNINCPGNHSQELACSRDPKTVKCQERCKRKLDCGHPCPGMCSEDCSQFSCQLMVKKNLRCLGNHSQEMACSRDPKTVKCQERCKRNLDCGHPCPGRCSQPCENEKCFQRVQKTYDCGHEEKVKCIEFKTATCKAACRRPQKCNHKCRGICGEPCSKYPCKVIVEKSLSCNHKVKMPCSYSPDNVRCTNFCLTKLPCGHRCPGKCIECRDRGSHEICQRPCNRILVCSHRCKADCRVPCPPCDRKCGRRCPHTKCSKSCSESCRTCDRPCKWSCPHYQCRNLCEEECDRPRCDEPCTKKLPCGHPCIGLCGENCPTFCATCDDKKISSMVGNGKSTLTETTRYVQLFDCGHILTVEEMDSWMDKDMGRNVQLFRCPKCSTAITFSYRYGNQVKRTLKNVKNVKNEICKLGIEKATLARNLLHQLRKPPPAIVSKIQKLPLPESMALDKVRPRDILTAFTLNNHLIIVREIEKAQSSLKRVIVQASLNLHPDMNTVLDRIARVLENITPYLVRHQPDLKTLSQVHERTRKCALFALLLEIHSDATRRQSAFSRNFEMRLKKATNEFILFLRENDDTLTVERLERIVALSRSEIGLASLPLRKPADFENFPGTGKDFWKLCQHHEVYFTRSIFRDGEEVNELRKRCVQCLDEEGGD